MIHVSILVPIYGAEQYIRKCARSLFSQSYPHCEFIFVDDASRDRSLEELRMASLEFPQRAAQTKIVEMAENGGVAIARNTALDAASGDYILFVDADDWVEPQIVEELVVRAQATDADICNAWCMSVDASGRRYPTPTRWLRGELKHLQAVVAQSHIVPNHLRGMVIRRSLFEQNNLRFTPHVDFGEDYSLLPQLLYHARALSTLEKYLYLYRIENAGSYMNNIGERQIRNYTAAEAIVSNFVQSLPEAAELQRAVLLGSLNIKKWILLRGANPREYLPELTIPRKHLLLRLYNVTTRHRLKQPSRLVGAIANLPDYLRSWL
ncbi:MAG: glycosyltransferase family 2 protein [Rikenellaceae bacterium]